MRNKSFLSRRGRPPVLIVFAMACCAVWSVAPPAARAEAGSLVVPAWSFARGNARVYASPDQYADAGPVVSSGPKEPWGWRVEYDVDIPVEGKYGLEVCYASAEARPMEVFFDNRNEGRACTRVTFGPASPGKEPELTWNSSGARWDVVSNNNGSPLYVSAAKGRHTVIFASREPLPHLVALRLTTDQAFPESWQPPQYKVRDFDSIPAAHRAAFGPPKDVDAVALRQPVKMPSSPRAAGSLTIPAWTFDRGNVEIYASPDKYAGAGPTVGGGPEQRAYGNLA